jgi:hypothetical protein
MSWLGETRNTAVQFRLVAALQEQLAARLEGGMLTVRGVAAADGRSVR